MKNHQALVFSRAAGDVESQAIGCSIPHSKDWLHAPPIASVCLRLSDKAVRDVKTVNPTPSHPLTSFCQWQLKLPAPRTSPPELIQEIGRRITAVT